MAGKHNNTRCAKPFASINCVHWINRLCVSIFLPLFFFSSFYPSPPVFITRDKIWMCSRVYTQATIQQRRKIGENDERKKKKKKKKMIRFTSHKWNTICRRFNCFISGQGVFIYCGVIEIAVGRGKNYIESKGASRKLSRLPNG